MKNIAKTVKPEYYNREVTQASTSKYIQNQIPQEKSDGYDAESTDQTPDEIIIKPNLKEAEAVTANYDLPALPALPIPFIKLLNKKKIKEKMPEKQPSEYGKIFVHETKGGFVDLRDETPDNRRWVKIHPEGTYSQVVDNGDMHEKIVNDRYIIIDKNWYISVGENEIVVIAGNNRIQVKKDYERTVNGAESIHIDKNSSKKVKGNQGNEVDGTNSEWIGKDMGSEIVGKLTEKIGKDYDRTIMQNQKNLVMGNKNEIIMGNLNIICSGNILISAVGMITITGNPVIIN